MNATIYERLEKDHRTLLGLLDQLTQLDEAEIKKRETLMEEVRSELIPHSRAEEAVLYNTIRDVEVAKDVLGHAYREHMEAESLFRSLQVTEAVKINWVNGVKKLKEALEHHIKEEEGKVFGAARQLFSEEEARAMGEVFDKMKPLVRKQTIMGTSLDMLVNLMPQRLRAAFSRFFDIPTAQAS